MRILASNPNLHLLDESWHMLFRRHLNHATSVGNCLRALHEAFLGPASMSPSSESLSLLLLPLSFLLVFRLAGRRAIHWHPVYGRCQSIRGRCDQTHLAYDTQSLCSTPHATMGPVEERRTRIKTVEGSLSGIGGVSSSDASVIGQLLGTK